MEGRVEMQTVGVGDMEKVHTISLGKEAWDRWHQFKKTEGLHSDSKAACLLLKWFESHRQNQWVVECAYCQGILSVSLMVERHRHTEAVTMSVSKVTHPADNTGNIRSPEVRGLSSGSSDHHKKGHKDTENVCVSDESGAQKRTLNQDIASKVKEEDYDGNTGSHFSEPGQSHSLDTVSDITTKCDERTVFPSEDGADDDLGGHERQKHGCGQCSQTFPTKDALLFHLKTAHQAKKAAQPVKYKIKKGNKGTHFECLTCKKSFPSKSDVESHTLLHSIKPHCCEFCQKLFKSSVSLGVHRRKFHSAVKTSFDNQSDTVHCVTEDPSNKNRSEENEQPFVCPDCGQSFKKSNHLSGHWKQVHSQTVPSDRKQLIKCDICQKSFKFKRSLTLHMKSHSNSGLGQTQQKTVQNTPQCDQPPSSSELKPPPQNTDTCSDDDSVQEQVHAKSADPLLTCSLCERTFKTKRGLQGHQQREHTKQWPRVNKCDKCDEVFRFKTQLTKHKRSHRDERPFSCGQCGAKFKSSASLGLHKSWHEDMRSSVCHLCGKSCLGLKSLTRHIRMHHGSEHMVEKPYKCSDCTASFTSLSKLTAHVGVHNHQKNYMCTECGQAFRSEHILAIHMRRHTGETPFQCSECPQSFIDKSRLKRHQLQHCPLSQELCHVCGAGFPSKAHLAFHIQRHTTERPFKCSQCGKAYKTTGDLKSHMMSHSDDRPFQCSHCSYAARTKAMLNKHVRKHTGERPYRCEQCSASFTYFSCLSAHRKLHSNTKPFVCEVCNASFFTSYNLRLHSRKHSGERPYRCPICPESFSWHSGLKCHMKKHSAPSASGGPVMETLA